MTVKQLAEKCGFERKCLPEPNLKINSVYCCDLLSVVMGRAPAESAWVTVMNNVNAAAVASLAEISVIVLADSVTPDNIMLQKAEQNKINIISSNTDIFSTALKIHEAVKV